MDTTHPFARQFYVFAKPVGATCNMACDYCYYLSAAQLYREEKHHLMNDQLLERFIREYIGSQMSRDVLFTWLGGEPLLPGLDFYKRVVQLQKRYAGGHHIDNCIQTNGTLIDDRWAQFLAEQQWLVGVSIDGPQLYHDQYRRLRGGEPTFERVMRGISLLNQYGVEWNVMAVVNRLNAEEPLMFYRFFKQLQCHYIQFTPIVEEHMPDISVTPRQWGDFLCKLFDEWVRTDVGTYYVQLFDATLANWCGEPPGICSMAPVCGHAAAMEWNGDVYSCDHFVAPGYKLGNIRQQGFPEMMYGEKQLRFGRRKRDSLPRQCQQCRWLFACWGECPKNRFATTAEGEGGLNYLCEGYRQFFAHVAPYMDFMQREYEAGRAPANVMEWVAKNTERI